MNQIISKHEQNEKQIGGFSMLILDDEKIILVNEYIIFNKN